MSVTPGASRPSSACRAMALCGTIAGQRRRFRLEAGLNRIGHLPSNDVVLAVRGVSRRHAILVVDPERITIEDLASKNGTAVDGVRVSRRVLEVGDRVSFGAVQLRLEAIAAGDAELAIRLDAAPGDSGVLSRETSWVARGADPAPAADGPEPLVYPPGWVPGQSPAMRELERQLAAVVASDLPVLVRGETGVGKEGIARMVHASSRRRHGPFVAINCAAIPAELLEAELFGIGPRVATGVAPRPGVLRRATGGTLFLDEVGDMDAVLQAKLLRALQEKEVQVVGGAPQPIDLRLVAATNTDLERRIETGTFRLDLYYRLAGAVAHVPPLRARREDVPALVEHALRLTVADSGKAIRGLTRDALARLAGHSWPGNVRELEHLVARLVHLCPQNQAIDAELVDEVLAADETSTHDTSTHDASTRTVERGDVLAGDGDLDLTGDLDLAGLEKRAVEEALRRTGGNRTRAARLLGISREALRRRFHRLGLA